ncbi:unnamed protein product [Musa hybrid cultivar]
MRARPPGRLLHDALAVAAEQRRAGVVRLRSHLQNAALNNVMGSVFGRRYDVSLSGGDAEAEELKAMVLEGFDLLVTFNWSDHLPWLARLYDPCNVKKRCAALVPRVRRLVGSIIAEHRFRVPSHKQDNADFVDVLLSLDGDAMFDEGDMIAVAWEMMFRGTDTTALLTEWVIAELVLHPKVQIRLRLDIDATVGLHRAPMDADVARMPYLQGVVKETLRAHPPGPLLSWARLSTDDVHLSNGMVVPAGTTAMSTCGPSPTTPGCGPGRKSSAPSGLWRRRAAPTSTCGVGTCGSLHSGRAAACAPARTWASPPSGSGWRGWSTASSGALRNARLSTSARF